MPRIGSSLFWIENIISLSQTGRQLGLKILQVEVRFELKCYLNEVGANLVMELHHCRRI